MAHSDARPASKASTDKARSKRFEGRFKNYIVNERTAVLPEDWAVRKQRPQHLAGNPKSKTRLHVLSESLPPDALHTVKQHPCPGLSLVFFTSPQFRMRDGVQRRSDTYLRDYDPNLHVSTGLAPVSAGGKGKGLGSLTPGDPLQLRSRCSTGPAAAHRKVQNQNQVSLFTNDQLDWFEWNLLECSDVSVDPLEKRRAIEAKPDASLFLDDGLLKELKENRKLSKHQQHLKECAQLVETAAERKVQMMAFKECLKTGRPLISQMSSKVVNRKELTDKLHMKAGRQPTMAGGDALMRRILTMQELRRTNVAEVIPTCDVREALCGFLEDKHLRLHAPATNGEMLMKSDRWSILLRHWTRVMHQLFPTLAATDLSTVWYMFDTEGKGSVDAFEWCLAFQFLHSDPSDCSALGKYALAVMRAWQHQAPQEVICINKLELQTLGQELVGNFRKWGKDDQALAAALQAIQRRTDWGRRGAAYDPSAYQMPLDQFVEALAEYPALAAALVAAPDAEPFARALDTWAEHDALRRRALRDALAAGEGNGEGGSRRPSAAESRTIKFGG